MCSPARDPYQLRSACGDRARWRLQRSERVHRARACQREPNPHDRQRSTTCSVGDVSRSTHLVDLFGRDLRVSRAHAHPSFHAAVLPPSTHSSRGFHLSQLAVPGNVSFRRDSRWAVRAERHVGAPRILRCRSLRQMHRSVLPHFIKQNRLQVSRPRVALCKEPAEVEEVANCPRDGRVLPLCVHDRGRDRFAPVSGGGLGAACRQQCRGVRLEACIALRGACRCIVTGQSERIGERGGGGG